MRERGKIVKIVRKVEESIKNGWFFQNEKKNNTSDRGEEEKSAIRVVIFFPTLFLWVTYAGCCSLVGRKQFFSPVKVTSKDYFLLLRDPIGWIKSHLAEKMKRREVLSEENRLTLMCAHLNHLNGPPEDSTIQTKKHKMLSYLFLCHFMNKNKIKF